MAVETLSSITEVAATDWDSLFASDNPFIQHRFLAALETHGCVGGDTGWEPAHQILRNPAGELLAASPAYLKHHSYGEFVFDFSWAQASQQLGEPYYPKLCISVPFTPVSGPRLAGKRSEHRRRLAEALQGWPQAQACSSLHVLFAEPTDAELLAEAGCLIREDIQFHWRNRNYADFNAFLTTLNSKRRKQVRRERRKLDEAGIRFSMTPGDELDEAQWHSVYALYAHTYHVRGQQPYLNRAFWIDYGGSHGTPVRVCQAWRDGQMIACALFVQGGDTLYGRHWGSREFVDGLHFETCYHQGIAWCIRERLTHFDAGTQGQHKQARGFDPVITRSAHALRNARLRAAVNDYLQRERLAIAHAEEDLQQHSAYRRPADGQSDPSALAGSP